MVTIRDVAREAHVSVATVSRVFNGGGPVREETRRRGSQSRCPSGCGTRRSHTCLDLLLVRALAAVLWLVLAGSIVAGVLSLG